MPKREVGATQLTEVDHWVVGLFSVLLYVMIKMFWYLPIVAPLGCWYLLSAFDSYARKRRDDKRDRPPHR